MSSRNSTSGAVPVKRGNGETRVKQIKDVPLFDGTKAKFPAWKQKFCCLAKLHGLFGIFTEEVDVSGDLSPRECTEVFRRLEHISRAIANNGDCDTLRHAFSSAAGWRALVDTYSASTLGAKVQCLQSLTSRRVKPGANPILFFCCND